MRVVHGPAAAGGCLSAESLRLRAKEPSVCNAVGSVSLVAMAAVQSCERYAEAVIGVFGLRG